MCDTWVALADATRDQHVIFGKNSDRPIFDSQPLLFYPRQSWPAGSPLQLEHVALPQVPETYATLGSSPYWCWGYEEGINEYGVVIGNEAIYTKPFRLAVEALAHGDPVQLGLLGMDLIRLALERSQSAAGAIRLMGELVEEYGQFGSGVPTRSHSEGSYDGSFIVADPAEAWVFETIGRRWVARRVTQGTTSISNQPAVRTQWDRGSGDVVEYARKMGWWSDGTPGAFDFARAYIDDLKPRQFSQIRAMRTRQLLAEQSGDITTGWMKRIARDHYEESFLDGPYFDAADPDFHTICMHASPAGFTWGNTASSCVAVLPTSAAELPVFWWTPGPPCNGCYVPFFVHGSKLPGCVSAAGTFGKRVAAPDGVSADEFSTDSYWWLFRDLLDRTKGRRIGSRPGFYPQRNAQVRARFDALEMEFAAAVPSVMQQAVGKYALDPTAAAEELDLFTAQCVEKVVVALHELRDEFREEASVESR
jgi:secernin